MAVLPVSNGYVVQFQGPGGDERWEVYQSQELVLDAVGAFMRRVADVTLP